MRILTFHHTASTIPRSCSPFFLVQLSFRSASLLLSLGLSLLLDSSSPLYSIVQYPNNIVSPCKLAKAAQSMGASKVYKCLLGFRTGSCCDAQGRLPPYREGKANNAVEGSPHDFRGSATAVRRSGMRGVLQRCELWK